MMDLLFRAVCLWIQITFVQTTIGCNGMLQCLVHIQGLVSEEFKGYPTAVQLNAGCPNVQEFKSCIGPIIMACEVDSSEQSKRVVKSLDMASDMSSFMCGKYKDDFLKYGSECFEKQEYTIAAQGCYLTTYTDPNATPPQTQEERYKQMSMEFTCFRKQTEGLCSAEALEFFINVESKFLNILGKNIECPIYDVTNASIPKDYYVAVEGHNVSMDCLFGYKPTTLNWYDKSNNHLSGQRQRFIGGTVDTPTLIIKNVQSSDAGIYRCSLTIFCGNSEDTTELKVLAARTTISPVQTQANKEETLPCYASGGLQIIWRRNGAVIDISNDDVYEGGTLETPGLTIKNVTRYHAGNYTCETSYDTVTAVSNNLIVFVEDKPVVFSPVHLVKGDLNDAVHLPCSFNALPKASRVVWMKDQELLNVSVDRYSKIGLGTPGLTILDTSLDDNGEYVCCVDNILGRGCGNNIGLVIGNNRASTGFWSGQTTTLIGAGVTFLVIIIVMIILLVRHKYHKNSNIDKVPKQEDDKPNNDSLAEAEYAEIEENDMTDLKVDKKETSGREDQSKHTFEGKEKKGIKTSSLEYDDIKGIEDYEQVKENLTGNTTPKDEQQNFVAYINATDQKIQVNVDIQDKRLPYDQIMEHCDLQNDRFSQTDGTEQDYQSLNADEGNIASYSSLQNNQQYYQSLKEDEVNITSYSSLQNKPNRIECSPDYQNNEEVKSLLTKTQKPTV